MFIFNPRRGWRMFLFHKKILTSLSLLDPIVISSGLSLSQCPQPGLNANTNSSLFCSAFVSSLLNVDAVELNGIFLKGVGGVLGQKIRMTENWGAWVAQ